MTESELLRVERVNKYFGQNHVLRDVSFMVRKGEFISILGPSGCGKTTLLRTVMGLENPDSGAIYHEGVDITTMRPDKRGFSIVFQDYALFPHMTLYDNVAYGLKLRKTPGKEIREKVMSALTLLKLDRSTKKLPDELSGGMQQRAAIARSLVLGSALLLLDEPFSALDAMIKVNLSDELKDLQKQFSITMLMVTHDQEEAFSLSDRILLMRRGVIIADKKPQELYDNEEGEQFIQTFIVDQINKRGRYIRALRTGGNNHNGRPAPEAAKEAVNH
jgi:ABC-type Fe3+/spermidine/putrescine transport system ATPase subunit